MQHTTKYKFNLIETSDNFGPDAINDNAEAVERELARVETETAAGDAAVRAEFAAADAVVRAEFAAADAKLSQTVAATEKGAKLFHLAGPVDNGSSSAPVTVDLSGIDMSQYRALLCLVRASVRTTITAGALSAFCSVGSNIVWLYHSSTSDVMQVTSMTFTSNSSAVMGDLSVADTQWNSISEISLYSANFIDVYGIKI